MSEQKQQGKGFESGLYNGNRMPFVLSPSNVPVDARDYIADLWYLSGLSGLIGYYDQDGKQDGYWSYFISELGTDTIKQFSKEKTEEIKKANSDFHELLKKNIPPAKKTKILIDLFWNTINLITPIYDLLVISSMQPKPVSFEGLGEVLLKKIPDTLSTIWQLSGLGANPEYREKIQKEYLRFSKIFFELTDEYPVMTLAPPLNTSQTEITEEQINLILKAFGEIFQFATAFVIFVENNVLDLLNPGDTRKPYYALIISFFGRLQELRNYLNTLTKEHLNFYYNQVLRLEKHQAIPDSTFVLFGLKQGLPSFLLPAGTEMLAGKDASAHDLIYVTDRDLQISSTQISNLLNLYVERTIYKNDSGDDVPFVKGIYVNYNPLIATDGLPMESWPLLGCPIINTNFPKAAMQEAQIGFTIASSEFLLSSGQRDVRIRFYVSEKEIFQQIIGKELKTEPAREANKIYWLFYKAFRISITGAEGWIPVGYVFKYDRVNHFFDISFSLTCSDPAIVAYNESIHQPGYNTKLPLLRFMLNTHDAPYFGYSLLQAFTVSQIVINTSVQNITDALLFSPEGKLVPGKPFAPFGATPDTGSYLMVGSSEAFSKKLDSLSIRIDWANLPLSGFEVYYAGYPNPPANSSFQVGLSLLQNGSFVPVQSSQQQFPLFISNPNSTAGQSLYPFTEFNSINLQLLHQAPDWNPAPDQDYAPGVPNGYLRIELQSPATGFGNSEFATALTNTITANMEQDSIWNKILSGIYPDKFPPKEPLPLPQPPFTPEAYSVKLNYTSSFDTNRLPATGKDNPQFQFFYNNPFGTVSLVTQDKLSELNLLPAFDEEGYLFIGLNELKQPCPLSIFFNLTGESYFSNEDLPKVNWRYLSSNGWNTFEKEKIINDGTESFIRPGIVDLHIPSDIFNSDPSMPGTNFWLSVSLSEKSDVISPALNIATQAVTVTWKDEENDPAHLNQPLPAGSIVAFRQQPDGVQSILQPLPSTGAVPSEDDRSFYMRISERLAHKQRASLPIDYERIIFQEFSSLYMVRCFPSAVYTSRLPEPGNVLFILVDKSDRYDLHNLISPKSDIALNTSVEEYIVKYCPPGIAIHVHNPVYEEVTICCTVKLKSDYDNGIFLGKLNQDIAEFIAPWLYDDSRNVKMGETLSTSEMIGFISQLSYVELVTGLSIEITSRIDDVFSLRDTARAHFAAGPEGQNLPGEQIEALFPWSVFISAASHRIQLTDSNIALKPERRGIGNLEIADDFILQYSSK